MNSSNINKYLIIAMIAFKLIPIKPILGMPFAPENILYYIGIFLLFSNKTLVNINKKASYLILLYLLYNLYVFIKIQLIHSDYDMNIFQLLKNIIFISLIASQIKINDYYSLFKATTFFLIFTLIWSLLEYFVGTPFSSLTEKIIESKMQMSFGETSGRLTGFTGSIFLYSYQLAVIPILILALYKIKRSVILIIIFYLSILGLILNGERASLVFTLLICLYLILKWFSRDNKIIVIIVLSLISIPIINNVLIKSAGLHGISRLKTSTEEDIRVRLLFQYAMLITVVKHPIDGGIEHMDEYKRLAHKLTGYYPRSPHNAYVNMGMYAGFLGWIILALFINKIIKLKKSILNGINKKYDIINTSNYCAFWAAMSVSLFHNAGLFTNESASIILFSLLLVNANIRKNMNQLVEHKEK